MGSCSFYTATDALGFGRPTPNLRAAAASAAASSSAFLASRSAALLFVLGAMLGAAMLLGRGLGLAGALPLVPFTGVTEDVRETVGRNDAAEAGRTIEGRGGPRLDEELLLVNPGVLAGALTD